MFFEKTRTEVSGKQLKTSVAACITFHSVSLAMSYSHNKKFFFFSYNGTL